MKLSEILLGLDVSGLPSQDPDITDPENDSRKITPGALFIAASGYTPNSGKYLVPAYDAGCRNFVIDKTMFNIYKNSLPDAVLIVVSDIDDALARISRNFFRDPSSEMTLIGITGTSGKTTSTYVIFSMLRKLGKKTGLIGTIEYRFGDVSIPAPNTTPDVLFLNRLMRRMADSGTQYLVMEVSSHSLKLGRVSYLNFDICGFTNFSQDHLDFHKTMDEYFSVKLKIFDLLSGSGKPGKTIYINREISRFQEIKKYSVNFRNIATEDYSIIDKNSQNYIEIKEMNSLYSKIILDGTEIKIPMIGEYNIYNFSLAMIVLRKLGFRPESVKLFLGDIRVKGRMEPVENNKGINIIIDYSHKPDALENILKTLRNVSGKAGIITVFGCGGDRDRSKRPVMGKIASMFSDFVIVTSDNPRTEEPLSIIREIEAGITGAGKQNYMVEEDRFLAIKKALNKAEAGDIVLIAGKGHEDYQIIGTRKSHFSDREAVESILEDKVI